MIEPGLLDRPPQQTACDTVVHQPPGTTASCPPGWYIMCRTKELRSRPLALRVGDRDLVAFRTMQGQIAVLDDRCVHRGTPLSAGAVRGECIECPYHGWQYGVDGRIALVPAMRHRPETWPSQAPQSLLCAEQDGFVWARIGSTPAAQPRRFQHLGEAGWTSFRMRTVFESPAVACLENFLDCPHATFVHRYWFRAPTARRVRCTVRTLVDGAEAEFFGEPREKSAVWWLLAPRSGPMRHVDRFVAPNTSEVEYEFPSGLHYVITSSCTPLSARQTLVHTVISFRWRGRGHLVRLFFEPLSRMIIRQDVRMLGRRRLAPPGGEVTAMSSTPADVLGPHIQAWRRALVTGATPPTAGTETDVELTI
jgi:phenylpropionate dioxygenase-like ring-hydroxylating dioxygenase large terminal subunit